jgi:regulator of protease activity HflC (stomatin/prohibitin superfamily)
MVQRETVDLEEIINKFKGGKTFPTLIIIALILVGLLFLNPFVTIDAGERGVVLNFGAVQPVVLDEGLHFRVPIMQQIVEMDVKIQKSQTDSAASTKDLQDTQFSIVLNHHIVPDKANWIYQNIGLFYKPRIIDPSVQEVVKAVSAKYTAEELITQREKVSIAIKDLLKKRLSEYNIIVDDFSIVNFKFSDQFTQAIEDKQTAEQRALKAKRDLDRIKTEAMQKVEQARAEATELRLKRAQVSPQVIRLREIEVRLKAIEKWNGILPRVTSGTVPFLDIEK